MQYVAQCTFHQKGELCREEGDVIGQSDVLYNTAMASWIRNQDIQDTHTHTEQIRVVNLDQSSVNAEKYGALTNICQPHS